MSTEKGHWITIEGRHIFIRDGESIDSAVKRAYGLKKEDTEDRKEKQINYNQKEADERNKEKNTDKVVTHKKTIVHSDSSGWKQTTEGQRKARGIDVPKSIYFKAIAKEGIREDGRYQLATGEIAEPAPEGTTSNEDGKYFSPDGKHWFVNEHHGKKDPWGDNPPAPKVIFHEPSENSHTADADGLYDITDTYYPGTDLNKMFDKDKFYPTDRATRFVAGLGENAQDAFDVLSDNAQGIFIDCPHATEVSFIDSKGREVKAKARQDNQGRISWTIRIDNARSGSGWSSRDLAGMLPENPKDFSMHIPRSTSAYGTEQPDVNINIKDGKVSKSIRSSKKPQNKWDRERYV